MGSLVAFYLSEYLPPGLLSDLSMVSKMIKHLLTIFVIPPREARARISKDGDRSA